MDWQEELSEIERLADEAISLWAKIEAAAGAITAEEILPEAAGAKLEEALLVRGAALAQERAGKAEREKEQVANFRAEEGVALVKEEVAVRAKGSTAEGAAAYKAATAEGFPDTGAKVARPLQYQPNETRSGERNLGGEEEAAAARLWSPEESAAGSVARAYAAYEASGRARAAGISGEDHVSGAAAQAKWGEWLDLVAVADLSDLAVRYRRAASEESPAAGVARAEYASEVDLERLAELVVERIASGVEIYANAGAVRA